MVSLAKTVGEFQNIIFEIGADFGIAEPQLNVRLKISEFVSRIVTNRAERHGVEATFVSENLHRVGELNFAVQSRFGRFQNLHNVIVKNVTARQGPTAGGLGRFRLFSKGRDVEKSGSNFGGLGNPVFRDVFFCHLHDGDRRNLGLFERTAKQTCYVSGIRGFEGDFVPKQNGEGIFSDDRQTGQNSVT